MLLKKISKRVSSYTRALSQEEKERSKQLSFYVIAKRLPW
jgi:hypothetical protein